MTSHDRGALNTAVFDNLAFDTQFPPPPAQLGPNMLANAGFEDSIVPATGPAWVSDTPLRQMPAVSEMAMPHSGQRDGACHTTSGDCGLYQEVTASHPSSDQIFLTFYARADHPGTRVGVNVDGELAIVTRINVGGYQRYTQGLITSKPNPVLRVWVYAPPGEGIVATDDFLLAEYFQP